MALSAVSKESLREHKFLCGLDSSCESAGRYWQFGDCRKGAKCAWRHDEADFGVLRDPTKGPAPDPGLDGLPDAKRPRLWEEGA